MSAIPSPYASLLHNAVILILKKRRFGITRTLHFEEALPAETLNADPRYLRVQKRILSCPEYQAIVRLDQRIKDQMTRLALPTKFLPGLYLVPASLIHDVEAALSTYQRERAAAVEAFLAVYPQAQAQALLALNILFDPANYPSVEVLRASFSVDIQYLSFDVPTILQHIDHDVFERERQRAATQIQQMLDEVQSFLRLTFQELITHLADRLQPGSDGQRKVLRQSAVDNLLEFLDTFDARNVVARDEELSTLVARCRAVITGVDARELKAQPLLANAVREELQHIASNLEPLIENAPRRRFRFAVQPERDCIPA
ncbi:MAG: hypothetical protein D6690_00090 [Nitrospirae bacterium]|nr:MAG: hypothetical protein D6690_00090 [Nitrospirota bacterium]